MSNCTGWDGEATASKVGELPVWVKTDPAIHVHEDVLDLPFFFEKYKIVGPCPSNRGQYHAELKDE